MQILLLHNRIVSAFLIIVYPQGQEVVNEDLHRTSVDLMDVIMCFIVVSHGNTYHPYLVSYLG